ncbi:MAG: O-antigen ligase [bacterium]
MIKSSPIGKRLHSALQTSSNKDRLYMWLAGWRTVKENLIFGVGPRMNKKMKPHYEKIAKDKKHRFEHQPSTGVHNIYLQNWVNFGIFGLLGYLLWWGSLLYKGISISFIKKVSSEKLENQTFLRGILSGFVGILIAGFFENNFRDGEVQIAIFLLMGTAMALIKKIEE